MEVTAEGEAEELRREHWKLLSSLKTTVEGLLSTNNPNVWSRYGGLQRLHKDMNNILSHGLKNEQVYYKQRDYWPFVWCVRYIDPNLASHVEKFRHLEPVLSSGMQSAGESYKAERWLLHSLQVHKLSAQLKPLLRHRENTCKYYNDDSFLLSEPHVTAMFQCLEAVEQNNPKLLAQVDTVGLSPLKGSLGLLKSQSLCVLPGSDGTWRKADTAPGGDSLNRRLTTSNCSLRDAIVRNHKPTDTTAARTHHLAEESISNKYTTSPASSHEPPWVFVSRSGEIERGPPWSAAVPAAPLAESPSPSSLQPEAADCCDGDSDDGPEYLAIGNLGQRNRRGSRSSTHSSGQDETKELQRSSKAQTPPRRSSFSEGQRGPGRGARGHTRSFSDTGINQKLRDESTNEDSSMTDYSPFSPQHSDSSTPSSLYMESYGSQNSGVPDGMFRKPSKGQSLISYLSEQDFGSCADLEKENAHFSISESLIAAIELMKYNLQCQEVEGEEEGDSDSEIQQLKQKIRLRRQQIRRSRLPPCTSSQHNFHSTDSGGSRRSSQDSYQGLSDSGSAEEVEECVLQDADIKRSVSSSGRSFLSSESISTSFLQSNSAESVAMGLLRQFEGMQLPAASELDWLVPEQDAPQKLLPIPDSLPISPDDGEHADIYKLRIRVRGNLEWAPPRPQIIFNIHPAPKRKIIVAKQNYRCAGCGTRIDPDYIKRLRYCEYLGRYFCQCCHENAQAVVPGRVLRKWDFSKYYVSNFARDLLSKIAGDPLFNPSDINSCLYKKVKALESVRVLRVQLFHMKNLFKTCRFSKEVLEQFDGLPGHLTEDLHLFSLNDLTAVRNGELASRMKELLKLGTVHVAKCVLCQAKGFVCEFCGNDKDIIFPFQLSKCQRCEGEPSTRDPASRISFPLNWKDWKIPNPRRLAKALQRDRREGEGGEEDVQLGSDQEEETGEEEWRDSDDLRPDRGGGFQTSGRPIAVPGIPVNEEEQEVAGSSESEREEKMQREEGGEEQDVPNKEKDTRTGNTDEHAKRENVSLLNLLKIDRLKKNVTKQDRRSSRSSDNEICSSRESLNEVGQEGKGLRMVLVLASRVRRLSQLENKNERETEPKEEGGNEEFIKRSLKKEDGTEEGQKAQTEAERERPTAVALLRPHQLRAVFSRERSSGEKGGHGSENKEKSGTKTEEGQADPADAARPNWRSSKTRKARRVSRGRKMREGRGEDGGTRGGNDDRNEEEKQS
ncbi:run domain Beclin-1-interacting and cysteine-rich domain-containing protein isoform X2 [Kryptolebias marmoratus]|uniref:run domain Beclin-1-interacting and cysteine-rich domain-containing protein isoform X2 n=1 Tax=Kryptolebias marmoratus TaxID=37003 RepID=UPI0018ACE539|nr:run domain Beclin-1-interacting and cysteine-rich domain-containing protein isoform X2 [Kryptolebias marmoratus]